MDDVAQFVREDGFDLLLSHRFDQEVGEQNVAEARDEAHDCRVADVVLRAPQQDVAILHARAPAQRFEPSPQGRRRQRLGMQNTPEDFRCEEEDARRGDQPGEWVFRIVHPPPRADRQRRAQPQEIV